MENFKYKDEDIVKDYTKLICPIWEEMIPMIVDGVIRFNCDKFLKIQKEKRIGPLSRTETTYFYKCIVEVNPKPLVNAGWDGNEKIEEEVLKKAYPLQFWDSIREEMIQLCSGVGLEVSYFDFKGDMQGLVKEI